MKRDLFDKFVQKMTWQEISPQVKRVNPALYKKITELDPNKTYPVYRVTYPYGSAILKCGILHLPNNQGNMVSLHDHRIPTQLKEDLSYNLDSNPVTLILRNNAELFLRANHRHFPHALLEPGHLLGAWGILDQHASHPPFSIWDLTSGARSLFMLPKISDRVFHQRLQRELSINIDVPKMLSDQWEIFRAIANHSDIDKPWSMEMLFFPKRWFYPEKAPFSKEIREFLQEKAWHDSIFLRNRYFWDFVFSIVHKQHNLDQGAYFSDVIKHLFSISNGHAVAFEPAVDDLSAPISLIQHIYVHGGYRLKDYAPIIMIPAVLKKSAMQFPVYFSPTYLTAQELSPKSNNKPSLISDLTKIKNMLQLYQDTILNSHGLDFSKTFFFNLVKNTEFVFYYINPSSHSQIFPAQKLPTLDLRFNTFSENMPYREFPIHNEFIRGCISIQRKSE